MHKGDRERGMLRQWPTLDITHSNRYQVRVQVNKVKCHFIPSAREYIAELYDLHRFEFDKERFEFIDCILADNKYLFPVAEHVEGGVRVPNPMHRVSKAANEWPASTFFLAEAIPGCIYIKFYHQANNCSKYADGLHNSMIADKDGHIPTPLIMITCTILHHALLEWQTNKRIPPKASKSKLTADRPDRSNYFNYKNDSGKNASCCAATGCKLSTSPGVAATHTFLMNTWNTLPVSYQQRVYTNTLATVKRQIQQGENPTPAEVISTEAVGIDNAIVLDYLTSEVALKEPEI